jgi:hypothetical protein
MDISNPYKITLEQGEAKKPYYELSEAERMEIAHRLFLEVTKLYEKFGLKPVTGKVPARESDKAK